jgi:aspartate/tyrosine/aromatic aminotransferase
MECVKKAEAILLEQEKTKTYLPIEGAGDYAEHVRSLLFNEGSDLMTSGRLVTADTPGGTGALRVAADLMGTVRPETTIWLSDPTWPNHPGIFGAARLQTKFYGYYDPATHSLDLDAMLDTLGHAAEGDVVVLHGCCHNPTGIDPDPEQWGAIAAFLEEKKLLPLIDFAYQGLGDGLKADAEGLRAVCARVPEAMISSSFSKNFGMYRERTGALTILAPSREAASTTMSHLKKTIRSNYSNPPAHGAAIVTAVLGDAALRALWEEEVGEIRDRINRMRALFVATLEQKGVEQDFSFIRRQRGMFSYSGLTKEQVDRLREDHSIYIVGTGRINVASMNADNMDRLCSAIADVL